MYVLLVEPNFYTRYPPLGLLKLSTYYKQLGYTVGLVRHGPRPVQAQPDIICITSLFTYTWRPVHDAIRTYRLMFPRAKIMLGGIYATLMPDHARLRAVDEIQVGIVDEVEDLTPDYSLVPEWKTSILFSSRGCIRRCRFCAAHVLEPKLVAKKSIKHLIHPNHTKICLWDNNILGTPYWQSIFNELEELGLEVDFNQGIDARLTTEDVAYALTKLKIPRVRLAYDTTGVREFLSQAIKLLKANGFDGRRIIVYTLYNFKDTPQDFLDKIRDLMEWGVVAYPMRYEPLNSLQKNKYVSAKWTVEQLEMVAKARRVIGYGGAFPPYEGLRKKLVTATDFEQAFRLRPLREKVSETS
ncbi:hypothetical protein ES703_65882 [subsurface metagenome]